MLPSLDAQAARHHTVDLAEMASIVELSFAQRGELLLSACRSASQIYQSRLTAGLLEERPAPWPASTWDFLKSKANHARQTTNP